MNAYTTEFFAACPKCGKKFRVHLAVRDHMRDKHKATGQAPTGGAG